MNEFGSKFVDNGERSRASRDGARQPGMSAAVGSSLSANAKSLRPLLGWQRSSRGNYALAALVVAALAAFGFALGRLRGSSLPEPSSASRHALEPAPSSSAATQAALVQTEAEAGVEAETEVQSVLAKARPLAPIAFVPIEVEPSHGEIWLDREVAGVGSVQLGPIDDGVLHELRFVAPEYESKTLFFRNTPPAGRVVLKRMVRPEAAIPAPPRRARSDSTASHRHEAPSGASATRRVEPDPSNRIARGPALAAPAEPKARPSADGAASDASAASKKTPRVKLIEVHMPRVEVLD